jgi:hypothetical protein
MQCVEHRADQLPARVNCNGYAPDMQHLTFLSDAEAATPHGSRDYRRDSSLRSE